MDRRPPLTLAVAQPPCTAGDLAANVAEHTAVVRRTPARVVVFPELSLTGYVLDAAPVDPLDGALGPLVEACADAGCVALVGAAVTADRRRHITTLGVTGHGVVVAYRKVCLGGDETAMFTPGASPAVHTVDGWRLGLGICKDTASADHLDATAALGIDVYVAGLVHRPDELAEQDARGERIARRVRVPVAFASAAGPSGSAYPMTAGHSTVWSSDGVPVARLDEGPGGTAVATIGGDRVSAGHGSSAPWLGS